MPERASETVYTADSHLRRPWLLVRRMVADLLSSRELAWQLLTRNLRAQYRQPVLGYLWVLLPPLAWTLVWVFLHRTRIIGLPDIAIPFPVYVLTGTLLWQGFVDALNSPFQQLSASQYLLTTINFPREALLMAGFGEVLFNSAVRFVLLILVLLAYRMDIQVTILLAPLGVLALLGFGAAIGLLLAPVGMLYPDVQRGLSILTLAWFFLTPIFYALPAGQPIPLLMRLNPVTPLLVSTRELMTGGAVSQPEAFLIEALLVPLLLLLGWVIFRLAMPHVIVRLNAG